MRDYKNEAIIQRTVTLPSGGKLYSGVDPNVTLRGMTIRDEIIRLNASENDYKPLADMLDRCIISEMGISAYDLCLGDFQYLIFQLRALTYGNSLELNVQCPYCRNINQITVEIDEIPLHEFTWEQLQDVANIELPMTHDRITLNPMTPRLLDKIKSETKRAKKHTRATETELFVKLSASIASIEDVTDDTFDIDEWIESLPMMDVNTILQKSQELDSMIGLDLTKEMTCDLCGLDFNTTLAVGRDFFRPRV